MTPRERTYPVLRLVKGKWQKWGQAIGPDTKTALSNWLKTAMQEHRADEFKVEGRA